MKDEFVITAANIFVLDPFIPDSLRPFGSPILQSTNNHNNIDAKEKEFCVQILFFQFPVLLFARTAKTYTHFECAECQTRRAFVRKRHNAHRQTYSHIYSRIHDKTILA